MRYDRLFTKLFCSPLLLESGVRAGFERVLLAYMQGSPVDLVSVVQTSGLPQKPQAQVVEQESADYYANLILEILGDTAVIHIDGAIDKHLSGWDRMCVEACDCLDIDRAIARVHADANVRNVLFQINSPGGTVNGVPETAARIARLGETKNTMAYIDGLGCSAAYWLASQAHQVFCTPSSMVGSIGVYLALLEQSRYLDAMGVTVETVKDGELKAAGASWKPLEDEERVYFQNMVDEIGVQFRGAVLAARPGIEEATMQGQSHLGYSAVDLGLVDGLVSDREDALTQF